MPRFPSSFALALELKRRYPAYSCLISPDHPADEDEVIIEVIAPSPDYPGATIVAKGLEQASEYAEQWLRQQDPNHERLHDAPECPCDASL